MRLFIQSEYTHKTIRMIREKNRNCGSFLLGVHRMLREKRKELRLTDEELSEITRRSKMARISLSEYIRRAALGKEVIVLEGLPELAKQLGKVGGNLNQAVILLREHRIENLQVEHLQEEVKRIWQLLNFQTGKLR